MERDGKVIGTDRKLSENTKTWKQLSNRKVFVFFPEISNDFLDFPVGNSRNLGRIQRKKSENFPVGQLLPCSIDFRCLPTGSDPYCSTWVSDKFTNKCPEHINVACISLKQSIIELSVL